jgi:integrase
VVDFADLIVPDLRKHLRSVPAGGLAFTSAEGTALSNTNFRRRVWLPALAAVGLEGVHIHDLRHTGNQFTANAGANPRELMARMGHDSPRAALIYMVSHPTSDSAPWPMRWPRLLGLNLPSPRRARLLSHLAREWHAVEVTR